MFVFLKVGRSAKIIKGLLKKLFEGLQEHILC